MSSPDRGRRFVPDPRRCCVVADPDAGERELAASVLTADGWSVLDVQSSGAAARAVRRSNAALLVVHESLAVLFAERKPTIALFARPEGAREALDLGADATCRARPLRATELRVRARSLTCSPRALSRAAGLLLDASARRAWIGNRELLLTPTEFDLLSALAYQPGALRTRGELCEQLWGSRPPRVPDRALDAHVARLRRKLAPSLAEVQAVWGTGFRLTAAPERSAE